MHQPPLKPPPCHHHHYIVWQQHHFISHYKIYIKQINQLVKLVNTLIWCLLLAIGWFVVAGDDYVVLLDISFYRCNVVPRTEKHTFSHIGKLHNIILYIFHCQWFAEYRGNVCVVFFTTENANQWYVQLNVVVGRTTTTGMMVWSSCW